MRFFLLSCCSAELGFVHFQVGIEAELDLCVTYTELFATDEYKRVVKDDN